MADEICNKAKQNRANNISIVNFSVNNLAHNPKPIDDIKFCNTYSIHLILKCLPNKFTKSSLIMLLLIM